MTELLCGPEAGTDRSTEMCRGGATDAGNVVDIDL